MIGVAPGTRVWLACQPVSMRKGFDGLVKRLARSAGIRSGLDVNQKALSPN
jgi:hypothetical protein